VLLDVYDTTLRVGVLRERFVDVGRPELECDVFLARAMRDGIAFSMAGADGSFGSYVREALRATTGHTLSEDALDHVMAGFSALPPQPDAEYALMALARAKVSVYAFGYGNERVLSDALDRSGLRTYLRGTISVDDLARLRPAAGAYHHGCRTAHAEPARTALVSVHAWDIHGAARAGLLTGLVCRGEGRVPATMEQPHVRGERLDQVVEALLALPG
jgi:2-haloacid dehalogenase